MKLQYNSSRKIRPLLLYIYIFIISRNRTEQNRTEHAFTQGNSFTLYIFIITDPEKETQKPQSETNITR